MRKHYRCLDISQNPYATVLMPEPMDYFASCSATDICKIKCYAEITAFEEELAKYNASSSSITDSTTITKVQESQFFSALDRDAYTPMKIAAIVQLTDCRRVCGGSAVGDENENSEYVTGFEVNDINHCIAIAGVVANSSIAVKKYCVPKAFGQGIRSEPSEEWHVWYSEEWSGTVIDLYFADVTRGDSLIALRDNRGRSLQTGLAREQFISVHPREIQLDPSFFNFQYGTATNRCASDES